jgi:hypothetical protein
VRRLRLALFAGLCFGLAVGWSLFQPVGADTGVTDSPSIAGWWTTANPGLPSSPLGSPMPSGGPDGLPSDVPAGGLEVSSLAGQTSYAAIGYYDISGAPVQSVVLTVDSSAANLPNSPLKACPLTGSGTFAPAEGGPSSGGPHYDCTTSVPAEADPGSGTISFAVGGWVVNGYLGVAVVAAGTGRTVFDPPGVSTIHLAGGGAETVTVPDTSFSQVTAPAGGSAMPGAAAVVAVPPSNVAVANGPDTGSPRLAERPPPASLVPADRRSVRPMTLVATEHLYSVGLGSSLVGGMLILAGAVCVVLWGRAKSPSRREADGDAPL